MKKIYLQRFIKFAALIVPIVLIVLFLQSYVFVFRDHNTERLQKFYCEEKDSIDVVILGASEVTAGYAPGYAYGQYGYTSYMYAMDGNVGSLYLAQLKEILSQQKPELIFVEVFGFAQSKEALDNEAKLRTFTESIPNSSNKWNTIQQFNYDDKISCVLPFIKYHGDLFIAKSQVEHLVQNHASMDSPSYFKGVTTQTTIYPGPGDGGVADETNSHINDDCNQYLVEFLNYCQQEKLDNIVFVNFPRYIQNESDNDLLARVAQIGQIVTEHGFDFLDLQQEKEKIGLDMQTDFYNSHHLNVFGQKKLTAYLGKEVIHTYKVTPIEQTQENKAHWQECASYTDQYFSFCGEAISKGETIELGQEDEILRLLH